MTRYRIFVGISVLLVSLISTTAKAQAKFQPTSGQYKNSKTVLFVNSPEVLRIAKRLGLKVQLVKLSKHELEKLAKSPATGCSCAAPSNEEGGGCFRNCLEGWGISNTVIIGCAIACGVTPVACAICLGASEWIVIECAIYCNPPWLSSNKPASPLKHNLRHANIGSQQAKLLLRQARVALR